MESQVYILNVRDINVNIENIILPDYCMRKVNNTTNQKLKYLDLRHLKNLQS